MVNGSTCDTPPATGPPQVQVINRPPKSLFKTRIRHQYRIFSQTIYYIIYVPKYNLQDHRNGTKNSRKKFPKAPFSRPHGRSSIPARPAPTTLRQVRSTHTRVPPNKSSNSPASSNRHPASSKKPTASSQRLTASSPPGTASSKKPAARSKRQEANSPPGTASSKRQEASSQAQTARSSRLTARSSQTPKERPISTPRSPVSTKERSPGTTPTRHSYR